MKKKDKKLISRVTSKGQVTIPLDLRNSLDLEAGDLISFMLQNNKLVINKIEPLDMEYHQALGSTLSSEWSSKEDDEAYNDL